jgi:hypothetical protein
MLFPPAITQKKKHSCEEIPSQKCPYNLQLAGLKISPFSFVTPDHSGCTFEVYVIFFLEPKQF